MSRIELLQHALLQAPETVLDLGVGDGSHAKAFIAHGATVAGVDVKDPPHEHERYTHSQMPVEFLEAQEDSEVDMVWCSHLLQYLPNVQAFLVQIETFLKDDGWLYIAVPSASQDRFRIGNLTLWTPALLVYNLICAGWDCKDAQWYTSYDTIGLCVKKKRIEDMTWRTGTEEELVSLNEYAPVTFKQEHGAWWANNWPTETPGRAIDPPLVTAGVTKTNLQPHTQLAFGPNPELRIGYEQV
jgi:2-polyprenyl-3-methyl-5-hydroxy-6-metoxy-1,4-benzoquinol methylase